MLGMGVGAHTFQHGIVFGYFPGYCHLPGKELQSCKSRGTVSHDHSTPDPEQSLEEHLAGGKCSA